MAAGAYGWQPYHLHVPAVLKSGRLILLEPSGPVHAYYGIGLHKYWASLCGNLLYQILSELDNKCEKGEHKLIYASR